MVRPKKPRYFDGVLLADNLYSDPKKRAGKWCYVRPDESKRIFDADTAHEANAIAKEANKNREDFTPNNDRNTGLTQIGILIEEFIRSRENNDKRLSGLRSWKNRVYALRKFGREMSMPPSKLSLKHINSWWDELTYYQQKLRHTEFRKAFNYWMGRGLFRQFEYNPFTTADDRPRLYLKGKPNRKRTRIKSMSEFRAIHFQAGKLGYLGLQIAMTLSLVTMLREGDILKLLISMIKNNKFKITIGKSEAQRGHAKATRLEWDLKEHHALRMLFQQARELSLKNGRCPFVVSHMPKRINDSKFKIHAAQLTKERLAEQFREACDATKIWANLSSAKTPPTFHEVRSLADVIAHTEYTTEQIQKVMGHADEDETLLYLGDHEMPHENVEVIFTEEMLEGALF